MYCEVCEFILPQQEEQEERKEAPDEEKEAPVSCPRCTFNNRAGLYACTFCGNKLYGVEKTALCCSCFCDNYADAVVCEGCDVIF